MFVAMNRFTVVPGQEEGFEEIWRSRDSYLDGLPGFVRFSLLRGDAPGEYISHSTWESRAAFEAWTKSENFRKAHARARAPSGTYLEHPKFEGFEVIL